ncbi:MAG: 2-C-methyl-D-erythritol 4-phosphate cytidylyltransferase [Actinobacteria bacterium]|nr:2-C-methyl-D-erythritol 4-phosphate cytidylyltransferase [Actinomycetota bacterium]MCL5069468.1 2-C-methyl-D-erythritol 4-phosphate cytidylyltransferase [Actinomycetota bacterium]
MIAAIITAAGKGTRLKSNISKQFMNIYGKPILAHSINIFQNSSKIQEIYVAVPKEYMDFCRESIIEKYSFTKVKELVCGGNTRQESVFNALQRVSSNCRIVSIHDGVRPLVTTSEVNMLISSLVRLNKKDPQLKGIIMAAPAYETVKKMGEDNLIDTTISRNQVCFAQTPQTFFFNSILEAHKKALEDHFTGTDDAGLFERLGWKVKVVLGRHENIKITTPLDLFLAELIISKNNK